MYSGLIRRTDVGAMLVPGATYKTYEVRDMLNAAEDVDAQETRHGIWTEFKMPFEQSGPPNSCCIVYSKDCTVSAFRHTECLLPNGNIAIHFVAYPRCPYCGAFMARKEKNK